jgi:hypothetical protein
MNSLHQVKEEDKLLALELVLLLVGRHQHRSANRRLDREDHREAPKHPIVKMGCPGEQVPDDPYGAETAKKD